MNSFRLLAFIFFLFVSCRFNVISQVTKPKIEGVIVESLFPDFELDTSRNKWIVKKYDPSFSRIYFYNDMVLLQRSKQFGEVMSTNSDATGTAADINYKNSFYTIVYSKSESKAMLLDSTNLQSARLINKDSALSEEPAFNGMDASSLKNGNRKLIRSTKHPDGDIEEFYSLKGQSDTTMRGSLTLIFSPTKMKGSSYSLDKEIEAERGMKLVKIITTTDERYVDAYKVGFGAATIPTELKELAIVDAAGLLKMFQHFEEMKK